MYKPEIILQGAPNARDLGGILTRGGREICRSRLIRSGMLSSLSDADVKYLESISLKAVVDFRTGAERNQKPDRLIRGVEYIVCPILEDKTEGVTRDKPETEDEEAQRTVKMAQRLMPRGGNGAEQIRSLYPIMVTTGHSVAHYRRFFEILLHHETGALLYHCTMGKDRVGVATALLLTALDVPREEIYADYLITRERCAAGTERLVANCRRYTDDEPTLRFIRELDTVHKSYLDAAFDAITERYGSVEAFLRYRLGLDDEKSERLKYLYTE